MPIIWGEAAGAASALIPGLDVAGALVAVGWLIIGGIAYWTDSSQPTQPYGVALDFCDDTGKNGGGGF